MRMLRDERHGGVLSQEGCWSNHDWDHAYDQILEKFPVENLNNFDRTLACAACSRSPMCTDVRLVTDKS